MKEFVLGFAFNQELDHVVLVLKDHPPEQAGYLNGVGGRLDDGETAVHAMAREFREETGGEADVWSYVTTYLPKPDVVIYVFTGTVTDTRELRQTTSEPVFLLSLNWLISREALTDDEIPLPTPVWSNVLHVEHNYRLMRQTNCRLLPRLTQLILLAKAEILSARTTAARYEDTDEDDGYHD